METAEKSLLGQIEYPEDLRQLPVGELPALCEELRQTIISELSVNPGHLASSLGVVELTVALHYVFNTPDDRIVWDVGHQAYGHKILTGRRRQFATNRKLGGLRPFPSPEESEYDAFICGHASNSISAALGMAVAASKEGLEERGERREEREYSVVGEGKEERGNREEGAIGERSDGGKRREEREYSGAGERKVVAVIGDGAMSGGLAFEGLNNVSSSPNDMLIVLNDNDMSIDRAVGGMEKYLLQLNTNETYNRLRFKVSRWLHAKGLLEDDRRQGLIRLTNAIKSAISHQQNIFEGMNIRYFGPFDGHNVVELVRILRQLKGMKGPKLLHLHTVKGKGYEPAEKAATIWHAPGKFDPETGERLVNDQAGRPPKYQQVFGETLLELARQNERIVGVTPAMPTGCSMNIMMSELPERTFDVGIAEGHAVTFSAGMAKDGLLPFCNIYSAFAQRAYDNIIHDVAILRLPVVLCLDRAGLVGQDGPTHHGAFDLAALRPIPNLTICSPMDAHELRRLMYTAQLPGKGPFVIRYPKGRGEITDWRCPFEEIAVGTGRRLRDGNDVAVLSIGPIGTEVEKVVATLGGVAHYDMRFLKPLDEQILHEVGQRFRQIITVEDGVANGGLGTAVTEWMNDHGYAVTVKRLGLPDRFVEHGTVEELRQIVGIDAESIRQAIIASAEAERRKA